MSFSTYYFRHSFEVEGSPAGSFTFRFLVDDGAVVYLDGAPIHRVNMPPGRASFETWARRFVREDQYLSAEIAAPLEPGRHMLAVEVHQCFAEDDDLRFDLELLAGESVPVRSRSVWRYQDEGVALPDAWRQPDFDDADWAVGPAPFGYGFALGGRGLQSLEAAGLLAELQRKFHDVDDEFERLAAAPSWKFARPEVKWQHDVLEDLVENLESFAGSGDGSSTLERVKRDFEFASTVRQRSLVDQAARWGQALLSISQSPKYGGLSIKPQLGLVPLGEDAQSGLWEFAHLQTGDVPLREPGGALELRADTGLVFVLLPRGVFRMGAKRNENDDSPENIDPTASEVESPVHEVELAPFFISKFEMTQQQWFRVSGENPSSLGRDGLYPLENADWYTVRKTLERIGLLLPTEAQWEYAARGGTSSIWWTGDDEKSLHGAENIADINWIENEQKHGQLISGSSGPAHDWLDDGYTYHAPVGRYRPNPFGLHDVAGNVYEWVRDDWGLYDNPVRAKDGERRARDPLRSAVRGGAYCVGAAEGRSAARRPQERNRPSMFIGVRPIRPIEE